jgi:hypothetical protein
MSHRSPVPPSIAPWKVAEQRERRLEAEAAAAPPVTLYERRPGTPQTYMNMETRGSDHSATGRAVTFRPHWRVGAAEAPSARGEWITT